MKKKLLYLMIFGTLVCLLVLANLPQSIVNHELNLAYASGHDTTPIGLNPPGDPVSVPEPSSILLIGSGLIAGAGIYLFSKYRNRKTKA